jgi:hypothetical protein
MNNYGKKSEIVNTHVQNIIGLPVITDSNPAKVNDFLQEPVIQHASAGNSAQVGQSKRYDKDCIGETERN